MQSSDLQVIKEIPGYKVILKTVLKSQIQQLVEQLADHTGEESVILTASVSDGSLSHLGSESGKSFLEDHDDIKSQFLGFCLKRHHKQKQLEKEKHQQQQQELQDPGGQMQMTSSTQRFGPRPRFAPSRVQTSTRQIIPGNVHPVSLSRAPPQGGSGPRGASVRHEPYPGARPRKPVRFDPQNQRRLTQSSPMRSSTETDSAQDNPNQMIKIEPMDNDENADKSGNRDSGTEPNNTESASPSHTSATDGSLPPAVQDGSESSSSTIINEPSEAKYSDNLPPGGLGLAPDFSNFPGLTDTASDNNTATDSNVQVKVEAGDDSELDLEITGVEPGQMTQPDYGLMPNLQGMGYDPSTSGAQGGMGDQSSQGYRNFIAAEKSRNTAYNQAAMYNNAEYGTKSSGYECDLCGKIIVSRSNLKRHRRLHTGEMPFTCGTCARQFSDGGNFVKHLRTFGHVKIANN